MGKTVVAEQRLLAQINQRMEKAGNWNLINNLEEKKKDLSLFTNQLIYSKIYKFI